MPSVRYAFTSNVGVKIRRVRPALGSGKIHRGHLRERPIPVTAIVATPGNASYGLARQCATVFDFEVATVQVVDAVSANEWLRRKGPSDGTA